MDSMDWKIRAWSRNFSLLQNVQTGSGTHLTSSSTDSVNSILGGKSTWTWRWPPTSIWCRVLRMSAAVTLLSIHAFMACTTTILPFSYFPSSLKLTSHSDTFPFITHKSNRPHLYSSKILVISACSPHSSYYWYRNTTLDFSLIDMKDSVWGSSFPLLSVQGEVSGFW